MGQGQLENLKGRQPGLPSRPGVALLERLSAELHRAPQQLSPRQTVRREEDPSQPTSTVSDESIPTPHSTPDPSPCAQAEGVLDFPVCRAVVVGIPGKSHSLGADQVSFWLRAGLGKCA